MIKGLIGIFIVAIIFFSPKVLFAHTGIHEIKVTKNGFLPPDLAITQGETITFINEDPENPHWPASNIHPTHGIYPEFDPKKGIHPGQSWQFKFEKAGVFRFHDHLYPNLTGAVTVVGESDRKTSLKRIPRVDTLLKKTYYLIFPESLKKDLAKIDSLEAATDETELEYWINLIGGKKYMMDLVDDSKGGTLIDCHQEAHLTGRKSFEIEGREIFRNPDYNCHSGYLHGALEAFMATLRGEDLSKEVEKLCKAFPEAFSEFECFHGIGHGFEAYVGYDLPQALSECKKLSAPNYQTSCFGGVFMENIMVAEGKGAVSGHQTSWVSDDPHFPCNGLDKNYNIQFQCYQMQTSRMLQLKPLNFEFLKQECLKSPKDMVGVCFTSMGRDIAGQTLRDPKKILELCRVVPGIYFQSCIKGALNVVIDFWGKNIVDQPQKLCMILEKEDKNFCYGLLGYRLKGIFHQDNKLIDFQGILFNTARVLIYLGNQTLRVRQICSKFEEEYVNLCINGLI